MTISFFCIFERKLFVGCGGVEPNVFCSVAGFRVAQMISLGKIHQLIGQSMRTLSFRSESPETHFTAKPAKRNMKF